MSAESEKVKGALTAFVNRLLAPTRYHATYSARVVSQNGDGTLELVPDDARIPGLSRVPIRYGVPGVTATVPTGSRALLAFAGGDPAQPMVTGWEPGTALVLRFNGGAAPVTRVGDAVAAGSAMAAWIVAVTAQLNVAGPVGGASGALVAPTDFGLASAGAAGVQA